MPSLKVITTVSKMRQEASRVRRAGKTIGFVPTMGDLHQGHLALLRRCRKQNDVAVLSVFVNPTQFGPTEDYRTYPRDKKSDCLLATKENVDIIFYPSERQMYPRRCLTEIRVEMITEGLCGSSRPGHFSGVATVVIKLLNIIAPDVMYLGQKDAQQCVVIKQMVQDLNLPVRIAVVPTVREKDGLACSSRNRYLSVKQRREAVVLFQALSAAKDLIVRGERNPQAVTAVMKDMIANVSRHMEYVACVDAETLRPMKVLAGKTMLAVAVRFGTARLIDNMVIRVK